MNTECIDKPITPESDTWRELDSRTSDGLQISLLWSIGTDQVRIVVVDARTAESFGFDVPPADARAAFHHPFSYPPIRRAVEPIGA